MRVARKGGVGSIARRCPATVSPLIWRPGPSSRGPCGFKTEKQRQPLPVWKPRTELTHANHKPNWPAKRRCFTHESGPEQRGAVTPRAILMPISLRRAHIPICKKSHHTVNGGQYSSKIPKNPGQGSHQARPRRSGVTNLGLRR